MAKEKTKTKKAKKVAEIVKYTAPTLEEAVKKIHELSAAKKRKFVESVDLAINLGVDAKQSDQSVRASVLLPHGSGKKVRVVVIATDEAKKKSAIDAGAILAGFEDVVAKIEGGFVDFDVCIATPDIMAKISKIAKVLGPRGLMPSPKNGTVTADVAKAVADALKGKASFKNDKAGIIHCLVGKTEFSAENLVENIKAVVKALKDAKPEGVKGKFIKKFYISTTMGSSVEVPVEAV
jgi:large subunit ribosomal protein L1